MQKGLREVKAWNQTAIQPYNGLFKYILVSSHTEAAVQCAHYWLDMHCNVAVAGLTIVAHTEQEVDGRHDRIEQADSMEAEQDHRIAVVAAADKVHLYHMSLSEEEVVRSLHHRKLQDQVAAVVVGIDIEDHWDIRNHHQVDLVDCNSCCCCCYTLYVMDTDCSHFTVYLYFYCCTGETRVRAS